MADCIGCGRELTVNEIALHKKIKDMGDQEFFCMDCLADYYHCPVSVMEEKMRHYIFLGCPLFEENKLKTASHRDAVFNFVRLEDIR